MWSFTTLILETSSVLDSDTGLNLQSTINTVLTILGMLGVITDVQTVNVSQDMTGTLEHVTNEVDSASQADKAPTSAEIKVDDKAE